MKFTGERMIPEVNAEDLIYGEHVVRYLWAAQMVTNKLVLDVACGSGYGSKMLAKKARQVVGVDQDAATIEYAKEYYKTDNNEFVVAKADKLPFGDGHFDVVVSMETIEHVADHEVVGREIKRVLKPDGWLILSTPVKEERGKRNKLHVHEFTRAELEKWLEKQYQLVQIYSQNNLVNNAIYNDIDEVTDGQAHAFIKTPPLAKYMLAVASDTSLPEVKPLSLLSAPSEMVDRQSLIDRDKLINKYLYINKMLTRRLTQADRYKQQLETMEQSTLWRWTQPLRQMIDWVKVLPADLWAAGRVIKKKGIGYGWYRLYWYLLGKKTLDSIPPGKRETNLINYLSRPKQKIIFAKSKAPAVSIVIPVYNQWDYTYACLLSIFENSEGIDYEIIIGDDGSTDETVNIDQYADNIRVIKHETNLGFVGNCNETAKAARGKYILLLNNDTNVQPGWLESMMDLIKRDKKIAAVGAKLIFANYALQEAGSIIWADGTGWNYGRGDDPDLPEYSYVKEVDCCSGACLLARTDLWRELNGFDQQFSPGYYEETDWCWRARQKGYKIMYQPAARVLHFGSKTFGDHKDLLAANRQKFLAKWKNVLLAEQLPDGQDVFWARDRSRQRQTILFIDHHVPMFDQDAGSRATWQYLQLLVDLGLNVKFMGHDFYAHEPYTEQLQQLGIEVLTGSWYMKNWRGWIKENADYLDMVLLSRPDVASQYLDFMIDNTSAKIFYLAHDLKYLRLRQEANLKKDEQLLLASEKWEKIERDIVARVDKSFFFAQEEVEKIKGVDQNIEAVSIPLFLYKELDMACRPFHERKDLLFVGGFNHPPNVDAAIYLVKEIWPLIKKKIPAIKLHIVGSKPTEEILALASDEVLVTGYVTDQELQQYYQQCRLAIMPLRFGAGVKGKVVEAIYHHLPIITSPIGAQGLPEAERVLILADEINDFAQQTVEYYSNVDKYNNLIANFDDYIRQNFDYEKTKEKLSVILTTC